MLNLLFSTKKYQKHLHNKENIITFVLLNQKQYLTMLSKEERKEKKHLEKELIFFLSYYREVAVRSEKLKSYFDEQIEIITEKLKEIGH